MSNSYVLSNISQLAPKQLCRVSRGGHSRISAIRFETVRTGYDFSVPRYCENEQKGPFWGHRISNSFAAKPEVSLGGDSRI